MTCAQAKNKTECGRFFLSYHGLTFVGVFLSFTFYVLSSMQPTVSTLFLVQLALASAMSPNSSEMCESATGFAPNPNSCVLHNIVKNKLRVVFMDYPYTTQNNPAVQKAAQLGIQYSCDDIALAVPEW